MNFKMRSYKEFEKTAEKASSLIEKHPNFRVDCKGIFGYSILQLLPFFYIPRAIPIDPMHTLGLGVMKDLIEIWINPENSNEPYYLGDYELKVLNQRIEKIKLPHSEVSRFPRYISKKSIQKWKAQEFLAFLIRYGPVILQGEVHSYMELI
jgi:hypothetical protein